MIEPVPVQQMRDFDDVADEFDFIFNNYFKTRRPILMPVDKGWKPPTDMFETDEEIIIVMDIAGITTQDVTLELEGNLLNIKGIRREHDCGIKRTYHKMEIDFGPFNRRLELPSSVDPDRVKARYLQGFLEIRLTKRDNPKPGHLRIEIL